MVHAQGLSAGRCAGKGCCHPTLPGSVARCQALHADVVAMAGAHDYAPDAGDIMRHTEQVATACLAGAHTVTAVQ